MNVKITDLSVDILLSVTRFPSGELRLVFKDGVFYNTATLDSVRNNANKD